MAIKNNVIADDETLPIARILFATHSSLSNIHFPSKRKNVELIGITIMLLKKSCTARLKNAIFEKKIIRTVK